MSGVSACAFILIAIVIVMSLRKGSDLFSPAKIFLLVWALAIGLADLKFSGLQHVWTSMGWMMLLLGICSFLSGTFVVYILNLSTSLVTLDATRQTLLHRGINSRRLFTIILVLFLLYISSYIVAALTKGFIPLFTVDPSFARTHFTVFGVGLLILIAPSIMFFVVEFLTLTRNHVGQKITLGAIFLCTSVTYFFLLQRYDFAVWATLTIVFLYYASRHVRFRSTAVIVLLFGILFYWIQSFRLIGHVENIMYLLSKMKFDARFAALTEPYMYVVMNLENFTQAVEKLDHNTYGYLTFNFLMSLTGLKHWLAEYFSISALPYLTSGYNTYTYLWAAYRDFGVFGMSIISFLLGGAIATSYYSMRREPTVAKVSLYGLMVFTMLISVIHLAPALLNFVVNLSLVYFVNRWSSGGLSTSLPNLSILKQ